jgi:hypothetical protein
MTDKGATTMTTATSDALNFDQIWLLFQETERLIRQNAIESERRAQENERQIRQNAIESERRAQEHDRRAQEYDRRAQEYDRRFELTERLLKENTLETERVIKENTLETERVIKESSLEVDKQLKELRQQIGGLGNKFGTFTEGMAFPSIKRILSETFKFDNIASNYSFKYSAGKRQEVDILAWSDLPEKRVMVVEVKSHANMESLDQLEVIMQRVREAMPLHHDKAINGLLAAVHIDDRIIDAAFAKGLYVASISNDHYCLIEPPQEFEPLAH